MEMLKVPVVVPAATVTDAGAASTGDALFVNATAVPPADAACDRVTTQVVLAFEDKAVAVQLNADNDVANCRDSVAVAMVPFSVAVSEAPWFAGTVPVEMLNVALTAPAATVTEAGTVKIAGALLVSVTTVPPLSAAADSVTAQVVLAFEDKVVAPQLNPVTPGSVWRVSLVVAVDPFSVAVSVAV